MNAQRGTLRLEVLAGMLLAAVGTLLLWQHTQGAASANQEASALSLLRAMATRVQETKVHQGTYPVGSELELTGSLAGLKPLRGAETFSADGYMFRIWIPGVNGTATSAAAQRDRTASSTRCVILAWPATRDSSGRIMAWIPNQLWAVDNLHAAYAGADDPPPPTILGSPRIGHTLGVPIRWAERLNWTQLPR